MTTEEEIKITEPNAELLEYITEAKKLGYENYEIREPLLQNGWDFEVIEKAFYEVQQEEQKELKKKQRISGNKTIYVYKNSLTVHLSEQVYNAVAKRAKRNMLTPEEQVEDIVRRSCVNTKKSAGVDNVDDLFLKLFSRKNCGKKK